MADRASTSSIDVQNLVSGALKLEVKLLNAGVDTLRVYLNQAARFSDLATETLQAVQDDKATLAGTARKLSDFGRQNVRTFAELSQRLGASYYDELDRLADGAFKSAAAQKRQAVEAVAHAVQAAPAKAARPARRKAAKAARPAQRKAAKRA